MGVLIDLPVQGRYKGSLLAFSPGLIRFSEESDMQDEAKTKKQLITELRALRQRLSESDKDITECRRAEQALRWRARNVLKL